MSLKEVELCHFLMEELFGSIVANVGICMCKNGYQPLRFISKETKLKSDQVS